SIWFADSKFGLASWRPSIGYQYRYPNGPGSESVLNMSLEKNQLYVAPGGYAKYFIDGIYQFKEDQWYNIRSNTTTVSMDSIYDIMNVLVDPNDPKRLYATTWNQGMLELYDGQAVKVYNTTNSSLSDIDAAGYNIWTYGLAIDEGGNLWVSNSGVSNSLCYKNTSGVWGALNFESIINKASVEQILIDKQDQKWVVISNSGGGILVYKGNTTATPVLGSNAKKLTITAGNGGLPSNVVYCLAEDLDDEIWVGTDKGVAVFYSQENVFSGSNFDAQQILLEQDGHVQILLETENVLSIAVDDANRKWIGTSNSGVYLMSADGTTQIHHFDISNSPLFSNTVKSITINHETGEVYFGTSKGIISYRGTSIEAFENFTDVYAFPNPVKHDYEGPIAIKGLMNNSTLKITDISGTLVYEMKSEGGQAIWYGKNFKDERVSSGVYMVFCTSEDGANKMVTKILVIN
ncbi:MAG TPA: two-component regulator propeller domain-containing protein, partial [Bacteroidia bacterium]|nr:two-component regulator propeller domain-containing protein [Bacteroidia bacterium]